MVSLGPAAVQHLGKARGRRCGNTGAPLTHPYGTTAKSREEFP